ncbi:MAG TPA: flavin reductase family protein [Hyphomicrobiaceae bacterium]
MARVVKRRRSGEHLAEAFRQAMRQFAATVTVVTTGDRERRFGITATAVTSAAMEPPSLLVCINRSASMHGPLTELGRFCVNILKTGQENVSRAFGGGCRQEDRFASDQWVIDDCGVPFLPAAQTVVFCKTAQSVECGTHTIFIGEVQRVLVQPEIAPLLYCNGVFGALETSGDRSRIA